MRRALSTTLCLLCAGCTLEASRSVGLPTFPSEVDRAALLYEDVAGETIDSSGLHPVVDGHADIPLSDALDEAVHVRLVGYSDAQLDEAGAPSELESVRIIRAAPGLAGLPAAELEAVGDVRGGRVTLEITDEHAVLSASWLAECTKILEVDDAIVDFGCRTTLCAGGAQQTGCRLRIDVGGCETPNLYGFVDANGEVVFEPSDELGVCTGRREDDYVAITCDGDSRCRIGLYESIEPLALQIDRVQIVPGEIPSMPADELPVQADRAISAVLPETDRVVAFGCSADAGRRFVLDASTLDVVETTTTGGCFVQVEPFENGYYGTVDSDPPSLSILDARGALTATVAMPERGLFWRELFVHPTTGALFAVLRTEDRMRVVLYALDADFGVRWQADMLGETALTLWILPDGRLGLHNWRAATTEVYDVDNGDVTDMLSFRFACDGSRRLPDVLFDDRTRRYVLTGYEPRAALRIVPESLDGCFTARYYFGAADLLGIVPWDDELYLVGAIAPDEARTARVALADPATARFLPGLFEVGRGPMRHMTRDPIGRVWLALPWTGEVVRLSP